MNHDDVALWEGPIEELDLDEFRSSLPRRIDLVAGCPPCQGFSSMRTLFGSRRISDARNDLVLSFLDVVKALRPRAVMLENVPGLSQDSRFDTLRRSLIGMGYGVAWGVLDAADFGIPQRRKRLILIAVERRVATLPTPSRTRRTVRDAIGKMSPPGRTGDLLHDLPENRSERVAEVIRRIPHDGGGRSALAPEERLPCHQRSTGFYDVYGRMAWDAPAPTITSGCNNPSKGRFLHPTQDRAITLREAALLQTFPAKYKLSLARGKEHAARMIGNAFPPNFTTRLASHVLRLLEARPRPRTR